MNEVPHLPETDMEKKIEKKKKHTHTHEPRFFPHSAIYTVKMNMLYLINRLVATDYKQYY